ncbi:MAG: hypothetical protein JO001_10210 [Alphaproteobacteria bacterium]|nr:hypothetical protein [Alphaproteobacteria bacterium]
MTNFQIFATLLPRLLLVIIPLVAVSGLVATRLFSKQALPGEHDPQHRIILDLLAAKPGRYIQYARGNYRLKEADGSDVIVSDRGCDQMVEPAADQIDDLANAAHLVREGFRLRLP